MAITRTINRNDYNNIRSQIDLLLGVGSGSRGYGQTLNSSELPAPPTPITVQDEQWDSLYYDLVNILVHQNGTIPLIPNVDGGEVIRLGASYPLSAYETAIATADTNRFQLALSQSVITSRGSANYSSAWSNQAQATITVTFPSSDSARYFFNSGGKIRFNSSRSGGSSTSQNSSWTNLLASIGMVEFGANTSLANFYSLTGTNQTVFLRSASSVYSANSFRIDARCDISDNSNGGATVVYFTVIWRDAYIDTQPFPPNDQVDGILSLTVEEQKATGILQPDGSSFTIISPSYSVSSITAS